MSAAHELVERGFDVTVYERHRQYSGGKARSVNVPGTNLKNPDKYLPGEHGFRFFPGFYKHVTDTMKRIPFKTADGRWQKNGCFANLVSTSRVMLSRENAQPVVMCVSFPRTFSDIALIVKTLSKGMDTGLTKQEKSFFLKKMWQLMGSSIERRYFEYESTSWWDYLEANKYTSPAYRNLLVAGLTRTLVAAQAQFVSTKTGGNTLLQLLYNAVDPSKDTDRVLNGPTNDRWLNPWLEYLTEKGVKYHLGYTADKIEIEDGKISGVVIKTSGGKTITATADYYMLAVPVERAVPLISADILQAAPSLFSLAHLVKDVAWMNGIQYYLNENISINNGHTIYSDSAWALTSISQIQFWGDYDISERYNGKVRGILSVDISDWLYTRYKGNLAAELAPDVVAREVWEQIRDSLNVGGKEVLRDDMLEHWYLDRDIKWSPSAGKWREEDKEPLLINNKNSWRLRPNESTEISNFFLAGDYVRTNTDLATMEGANESARRAVNAIIRTSGVKAPFCKVWPLTESGYFQPLKWWDKTRFFRNLPYSSRPPWWLLLFMVVWTLLFIPYSILAWAWATVARQFR